MTIDWGRSKEPGKSRWGEAGHQVQCFKWTGGITKYCLSFAQQHALCTVPSKTATRGESECLNHKEMINVWNDGYSNYSDLFIA